MGDIFPSLPVLITGIIMTAIIIAIGVPLMEENLATEETVTERTVTSETTVTTGNELEIEIQQSYNQLGDLLATNRVLIVIVSILAGFNGVMIFLIHRFLKTFK